MTPDERWLAAAWPFVRAQVPSAPARVLEIGCGPLGGFVPALLAGGYEAVGVDPEAPDGPATTRSNSSGTGRHGRCSAWWRPRHCTTWPTWTRS
jgi:hypothetical protein